MQHSQKSNNEDCLENRFQNANVATEIALERNRLWFLLKCQPFKRPPQSLRVSGVNALPDEKGRRLIQEFETKALQCAIDEKVKLIAKLEAKLSLQTVKLEVDCGLVASNRKKLYKKLMFFEECELTKWEDWEKKNISLIKLSSCTQDRNVAVSRKMKRKIRSKRRKLFKKEAALKSTARYALENNLVRNLTTVEVPLFSIAVLSYGPGFIPTPTLDRSQFKVDALNAANKQVWSAVYNDSSSSNVNIVPPSLLKNAVTASAPTVNDRAVNQSREMMKNFASSVNAPKCKSKLDKFELEGLQWLQAAVKTKKIAITEADKGGCILIVTPDLIVTSTLEKLSDTKRYKKLGSANPLPDLKSLLISLWKFAVLMNFVSCKQAEKTVGLYYKPAPNKENPFNLSTADKFKPGVSIAYPLFKVHKLTLEQLNDPNVRPPVRLVTDLHCGVSSRSDKFVVWNWLGSLCREYAVDLVKDSTEALLALDSLEKDGNISDSILSFTLDVVSLYDSLRFDVVRLALNDAMDCCRPDWSDEFRKWFLDIVCFCFESAVVNFQGVWYEVKDGIPTGGIQSVEVANISVFYVFKQIIYNQRDERIVKFLRFVDDGLGIFNGDICEFESWFKCVKEKSVDIYGLDLTVDVNPVTTNTQFLDISFKFNNGVLTTDIFRKATDANRYLFFNSYHPRHMFRSIVHTQGLRYRRVINNNDILRHRLNELKTFFIMSGYPERMVSSILDDIQGKPRSLQYNHTKDEKKFVTPWVVTYGPGFDETRKVAENVNELLSLSDTWRDKDVGNVVQVVARRAPNLKDMLFKRRSFCVDPKAEQGTVKCGAKNCMCCKLVSKTPYLNHRNNMYKTVGGDCNVFNVVYCFQCKLCNILYVGKTVDSLKSRANGHRSKFYGVLRSSRTADPNRVYDDEQIVGAHLVNEHGLKRQTDFNHSYRLFVLALCNPVCLRTTEQLWIDKLKTMHPFGLNQKSSVGD